MGPRPVRGRVGPVCRRRARRQAKGQQRALLTLELEGFVALTRHTATGTLTGPLERGVVAQVADALREALRERRRTLRAEAGQLRRDGGENDYRRGSAGQPIMGQPLPPASSLPGGATDRAPPPAGGKRPRS